MLAKIENFHDGKLTKEKLLESFQGWQAYARHANSLKLRKQTVRKIYADKLARS